MPADNSNAAGCPEFRRLNHFSRRGFLQLGTLGTVGLTLPDILRAKASAGSDFAPKARSAILIWLDGGPTHHDTFDPKPDATAQIRGEYSAIATDVSGVRFAGSMPKLAGQMRRLTIIRTLTHRQGAHEPGRAYMISGARFRPGHNFPSAGGVVSQQRQDRSELNGMPPYVAIPDETIRGGGHLGSGYNPLSIPGDPNAKGFRVQDLFLPDGLTPSRFLRRRGLSRLVNDEFRHTRQADVQKTVDKYTNQAYDMILSSRAQSAFDLTKEGDQTRDRYGRSTLGQRLLLARRLVEAEVPFITASGYEWDDHRGIFPKLKTKLPVVDQAVSALVEDLDLRGLLETTLIVMMGEFGRTPKINENGGRDHWPNTFSVLLAGGGVRGGHVIGESDKEGGFPKQRPVTPEELYYSLFTLLGIDPEKFLMSTGGRAIQIVSDGEFIPELTS